MSIALKEQGVILDALLDGRFIAIFRKGGIIEPGGGEFSADHSRFWIFPTIVHQREEDLSPALLPYAEKAKLSYQHISEKIPFFAVGEIAGQWYLDQEFQLEKVLPESPLSLSCLKDRFYFGKKKGLWMLALKVFQTEKTYEEPYTQLHSGCKSWVDLPEKLETGQLTPALSDSAFSRRLEILSSLLPQP